MKDIDRQISSNVFVNEMRIFWQNKCDQARNNFSYELIDYFGEKRARPIINKLQEQIEEVEE